MTEEEWSNCADLPSMLTFLRGKASGRKARLFATACVRRVARHWSGFGTFYLAALYEAERYADDYPSGGDSIRASRSRVASEQKELDSWHHDEFPYHYTAICRAMRDVLNPTGLDLARLLGHVRDALGDILLPAGRRDEERLQLDLIRDIFGNPFRPVTINSAWLTPTVLSLAQAVYDERIMPSGELDPARLAVLSDALEECVCDDAEILDHLRSPGPHVRGCWAVDLILGKS